MILLNCDQLWCSVWHCKHPHMILVNCDVISFGVVCRMVSVTNANHEKLGRPD
jgi:hypothetical protein